MHSAVPSQHCRFCGSSTVTGNARPKLSRAALHRRVSRHAATRASSVLDHADLPARSSESHDKSHSAQSDTVAVTARNTRQRKLDASLPYVAVLRATKEHRHPVQEQQRALGMAHPTAGTSCNGMLQVFTCAAMLQRTTCNYRQASTPYLMHKR